jgi:Rrf2 family protein
LKISTKGRYSLRFLLDLAEHRDQGFIALKDIARRQGISKKYLEQLVPLLNRPELLHANRGYQGGYKLAKPPEQYTVGQILRITEGGLCPVACLENDPNACERAGICKTLPVWKGLQTAINNYLDGITLQTILDNKGFAENGEYCI